MLINQILATLAVLAVGVVYGTDVFHAIVVKKAATLSSDKSIADLIGHTHLIADKRMPIIGATGLLSCLILTAINYNIHIAMYSGLASVSLILHLVIYLTIAKPINQTMSKAALNKQMPTNIRQLQQRWDSVIIYRAIALTIAMIALILGLFEM
ncbi:DUF1772 domain-containing protein [Mucilaginibacter roseus]|uniref:DUF1772 domain-containing protein n=1 Tax=Mucilaginibacter roseus TaxID=1528868 RepID=A0ABS8TW73_9SPHI|nr:DUF1772 domain-containing protein [Mucilaginibacter roseus]MCD8739136.1 DUF1772 domain-containing protein [Mucilaginibacter roseus]